MDDDRSTYKKYVLWGVLVILVILSYFIIHPYITALASAFILAYLVRPLCKKLQKKMPNWLAALICTVLVLLILVLPLLLITGKITAQAYNSLQENNINLIINKIASHPYLSNIDLQPIKEKGISIFIQLVSSTLLHLPNIILTIFVTIFGMYYILLYWDSLSKRLRDYLPFKDKDRITKEIAGITNNLVYGTILIGMIEFVVASIGLYFSHVPAFLLISALIFLAAFIPGIGPGAIWVPTAIYYLLKGNYGTMTGVIITGLIISILVDTILRNIILSKQSKINPLVLLVGILGGVTLFGIFGFIIGPLVLSYTLKIIEEIIEK